MESFEDFLRGHILVKGVPRSYVVISEEAVAPSLDEPKTSFLSDEDEMVVCAPILEGGLITVTFKTDMMKVWGLISVITRYLDFHHVCLEGYGNQTTFKNWCARNHLIFG